MWLAWGNQKSLSSALLAQSDRLTKLQSCNCAVCVFPVPVGMENKVELVQVPCLSWYKYHADIFLSRLCACTCGCVEKRLCVCRAHLSQEVLDLLYAWSRADLCRQHVLDFQVPHDLSGSSECLEILNQPLVSSKCPWTEVCWNQTWWLCIPHVKSDRLC